MKTQRPAQGKAHQTISGPAVWDRATLDQDNSWRFQLSETMNRELHDTLSRFDAESVVLKHLTPEDFPWPSFSEMAANMRQSIAFGRGVALVSGLEVARYTTAQVALAFYGMGLHLGTGVSQSHKGDYIGEVRDHRNPSDPRPYRNGGEFIMHTDPVDVVGLVSIRRSKAGGESRIISSAAVHNTLLAERPDVMDALYQGYHYKRTEADRGDTPLITDYRIPVFKITEGGEFMSHYIPGFSETYPTEGGVPPEHLEEATAQAALKDILWHRESLYYDFMMQPGDIQFVNNRLLMHARTDYEDWPEPERCRFLLRQWLQMPELGKIPADQQYFTNTDRAGGGIAKAAS